MKLKNLSYVLSVFILVLSISFIVQSKSELTKHLQEDPYAAFAETMPAPVGGLEAVIKRIVYPEMAKKVGLEGKMYLLVYVDEKGEVNDVKVIKGLGGGCDEAAEKAIKGSKFTPGKNGSVPVKVKLSLPITFKMR